jgi:hypothetical protein
MNVNFRPQPDQRSPQEQLQIVLDALGERVTGESGEETNALCPAHDDNRASLSLRAGDRGVVLHCHAGCESGAVLKALGLTWPLVLGQGDRTATGLGSSSSGPASRRGKAPKPSRDYGVLEETYHYLDEVGTLLFGVERRRLKNGDKGFQQWAPDPTALGGRRWKDVAKRTRRVPYSLPELLARPTETLWWAEGEKDVHNLTKLGLLATTTPQGADSFEDADTAALDAILTPGRTVRIIPDQDAKGRAYAAKVAQAARDRGCLVEMVSMPAGCKDATDAINAGWGAEDFQRAAKPEANGEPAQDNAGELVGAKRAKDGRFIIPTPRGEEYKVRAAICETIGTLTDAPLYAHKGRATVVQQHNFQVERVCPRTGEIALKGPVSRGMLRQASTGELMDIIGQICAFRSVSVNPETGEKRLQPASFPFSALKMVSDVPRGLKNLYGLLHGPVYDPGTDQVIATEGYHPSLAMHLTSGVHLDVPAVCTREMARESAERILRAFGHFPWADGRKGEVDRSKVLVFALTAKQRHEFTNCPIFLVDAPMAGAGKTTIVDSIGLICHGDEPRRLSWVEGMDSDNEMRKRMASLVEGGDSFVLLDNIPEGTEIFSPVLCNNMTGPKIEDRGQHLNSFIGGINHLLVAMTGNNVTCAADLAQRTLVIHLEATEEDRRKLHPSAFGEIGLLLDYVRRNRAAMLTDLMIIERAYQQAGRPECPVTPWASFENWVDHCVQPVAFALGIDPLEGHTERWIENDPLRNTSARLASRWLALTPKRVLGAGELIRLARDADDDSLQEALAEIAGVSVFDKVQPKNIGIGMKKRAKLGACIDLPEGKFKITLEWNSTTKSNSYRLDKFRSISPRLPEQTVGTGKVTGTYGELRGVSTPSSAICSVSPTTTALSATLHTAVDKGQGTRKSPQVPVSGPPAPESSDQSAESIPTPASAIDREAIQRRVKEGLAGLRAKAPVFRGATPADDPADLAGTKLDAMRGAIRASEGDRDRARAAFLASGFTKADWDHYLARSGHQPEVVAGRVRLVPSA